MVNDKEKELIQNQKVYESEYSINAYFTLYYTQLCIFMLVEILRY